MQYAAIHPYLLQRALYGVEGALLFLLHSSVDWMCCVLMLVLGVMQWSTWNEPQPFLFLVMVERFGAVAEGRVDHFVWCAVEVSRLVNTVGFQLNSVKMRWTRVSFAYFCFKFISTLILQRSRWFCNSK